MKWSKEVHLFNRTTLPNSLKAFSPPSPSCLAMDKALVWTHQEYQVAVKIEMSLRILSSLLSDILWILVNILD